MEFEDLTLQFEGRGVVISLNRPGRYNAIGARMVEELSEALEEVEAKPEVRAVILTGSGERAFCSGVDLKERAEMDPDAKWDHNRALGRFVGRLSRSQVPTIAAVGGLAFGGGFELALACDFRVASEDASFALPEVGLGIIPGAGGTQRLPRLVGPSRAKELILTARRIDAAAALEMGILNKVVPPGELMDEALALAAEMAKNSPLAIAHAKAAVDVAMETPLEQGLRFETGSIRTTLASEDYEEGLAAFAGKRSPEFQPLGSRNVI